MKNGTVSDKLRMQERELKEPEKLFAGEKKNTADMHKHKTKIANIYKFKSRFKYSDTTTNK